MRSAVDARSDVDGLNAALQAAAIFAFDLLQADREELRHRPLMHGKAKRRTLLKHGHRVRIAERIDHEGQALYDQAGQEGFVVKRVQPRPTAQGACWSLSRRRTAPPGRC